jgi:hypothetical protein
LNEDQYFDFSSDNEDETQDDENNKRTNSHCFMKKNLLFSKDRNGNPSSETLIFKVSLHLYSMLL